MVVRSISRTNAIYLYRLIYNIPSGYNTTTYIFLILRIPVIGQLQIDISIFDDTFNMFFVLSYF